jgi:3-deoxy-7-phosphoheptulonate synthase
MRRPVVQSVVPPDALIEELPIGAEAARGVDTARQAVRQVLSGADDRLLVVGGPCSIHDANAALAYAKGLRDVADELARDLLVVMRVYLEKPRTTVGWPGLLADPGVNGRFDLDRGLRSARALMAEIAELGVPIATEWLSPLAPAYLADLVSWGAIGARTVESQVHRQLASGLPMAIGMKNSSSGSVQVAVDAVRSAAAVHAYLGVAPDGTVAMLRTSGNPDCHVVLRGAAGQPNYFPADVRDAAGRLQAAGLLASVVIDASHDNSGKDHVRQVEVALESAKQITAGDTAIRGLMLESFLVPGRQEHDCGKPAFGQSITDACIGWDTTVEVLKSLAESVRRRRSAHQ